MSKRGTVAYDPSVRCGFCGAACRRKYEPGKGKGSRIQHPTEWVCENGHPFRRKRF